MSQLFIAHIHIVPSNWDADAGETRDQEFKASLDHTVRTFLNVLLAYASKRIAVSLGNWFVYELHKGESYHTQIYMVITGRI